jgi:hypothetical protein
MNPRVIAGERPLLAFVSSVMRPEIQWARDAAVEALTKNPTLLAWAFEYTPASSEAADASYLSKVREADVVVWLVGAITTPPVRDEIAEALAANKRIWAITLPADERDEPTTQLLRDVRGRAKTAAASNADELRELLALAFSDEIVRALRDTPGLTRLALLEQLGRRSRARMVTRWVAVGLETAEAIAFANDPSIGAPPPDVLPDEHRPLSILVGDVGAGKSVVAERAVQLALVEARERVGAPIPTFLHMRDASGGLEAAIGTRAEGLGDPRLQGAYVVVDGADEVAPDVAARVIEEARELTHALPQTRILITSRPTAALRRGLPERVELPPLTAEDVRALVGRVGGYEITVGAESGWPKSVRDAVRRPLFAILMGLNRRSGRSAPQTTGQLLAELVEGAVDPAAAGQALPTLRRLARLVTDAGAPVDRAELGDTAARAAAAASRIVREEGGRIDFALPLLTEWFAGEALVAGDLPVADLVTSPPRLDRWRYALAIALATGPRQFVDDAMGTLVAAEPAFAAEIVEESFQRWATRDDPLPTRRSAAEVGGALRTALATWGDAIQPLKGLLLPLDANGNLMPLGVGVNGRYLTLGWYRGAGEVADVSELPADTNILEPPAEWAVRRSGIWSDERGWAWRWALELLRDDLKKELATLSLGTDDESLVDEAMWLVALEAVGRSGSLRHDPIAIETVEAGLAGVDQSKPLIKLRDRFAHTDQVLARVSELRDNGVKEISSPWPAPDEPDTRTGSGWIWDPYSPEQQRRRVEAVYAAALRAYASLVDAWFPRLRTRMRVATTLPAILRGEFTPSTPTPPGVKPLQHMDVPTMSWYLDPLPEGATSDVEITIATGESEAPSRGSDEWRTRLEQRQQKLIELRPDAVGWISTVETHGVADVFQTAPLAPLVYEWLKSDLAAIKWH